MTHHDADNTREGHTPEKPAASEIGELGTPGAGATPDIPHAADAQLVAEGDEPADPIAHHGSTHMDAHSAVSDDDHGHAESSLGPIDWGAWGLAVIGGLSGVVVLAGFWIALN